MELKNEHRPDTVNLDDIDRPVYSYKNPDHDTYEVVRANQIHLRDGK